MRALSTAIKAYEYHGLRANATPQDRQATSFDSYHLNKLDSKIGIQTEAAQRQRLQ